MKKINKKTWREDELYILLESITERQDKDYQAKVISKLMESNRTLPSVLSTRSSMRLFFKNPEKLIELNTKLYLFMSRVTQERERAKLINRIDYLEGMLRRQEPKKNWLSSLFFR